MEYTTESGYRARSNKEVDYDFICQHNQDRFPFMQQFMNNEVTSELKKTAKSYHKKSK